MAVVWDSIAFHAVKKCWSRSIETVRGTVVGTRSGGIHHVGWPRFDIEPAAGRSSAAGRFKDAGIG